MLVCEDVRFEIGGTFSLIGVFNERLIAPPGEGDILIPRLSFVAVIGGLRGVDQIAFRQWIRAAGDELDGSEMAVQPHDPESDEHNFVFAESPMVFPGEGMYEVAIDLEVGPRRTSYRYPFSVVRRGS
jgi:hypothetical protein